MSSIRIPGAVPIVLVAALAAALGGCATITRSPSANWTVTSLPEGAEVTMSNGGHCDATPCSFKVPRRKEFEATLSKPGYDSKTLEVTPELSGQGALALAGNAVVGGLPGIVVDAMTGAMMDPSHNGETVKLEPYAGGTTVGATGDTVRVGGAVQGCSAEKSAYARQIGVPCESLSERVDFRPRPMQTAASQPAPTQPAQAAAKSVETANR